MLFKLILTGLLVFVYTLTASAITGLLESIGKRKAAAPHRAVYISKVFNFLIGIAGVILLSLVWGVDYGSAFVLASSVLAVIGVAFFAQWSILSNITASIVIFFSYPARIGDRVKVVDGDNSVIGSVQDISLFHVLIKNDDGNLVNYPNNLIITKPLIRLDFEPAPETQTHEEAGEAETKTSE